MWNFSSICYNLKVVQHSSITPFGLGEFNTLLQKHLHPRLFKWPPPPTVLNILSIIKFEPLRVPIYRSYAKKSRGIRINSRLNTYFWGPTASTTGKAGQTTAISLRNIQNAMAQKNQRLLTYLRVPSAVCTPEKQNWRKEGSKRKSFSSWPLRLHVDTDGLTTTLWSVTSALIGWEMFVRHIVKVDSTSKKYRVTARTCDEIIVNIRHSFIIIDLIIAHDALQYLNCSRLKESHHDVK